MPNPITGISMNILQAGTKSLMQFIACTIFKNSAGNKLTALRLLGKLHNFCNLEIISSSILVTIICKRATYFNKTD